MTEVKISMQISVSDPDLWSEILITVDDATIEIVTTRSHSLQTIWQGTLHHGSHVIAIHHLNNTDHQQHSGHFGISVDYLRFQDVDHDFSSLGQIQDATRWILDFQVPVYRWMHQKMNLGWLI